MRVGYEIATLAATRPLIIFAQIGGFRSASICLSASFHYTGSQGFIEDGEHGQGRNQMGRYDWTWISSWEFRCQGYDLILYACC